MTDVNEKRTWGLAEIAKRFGVPKQTADSWTNRATFPKPKEELEQGRIWDASRVVKWYERYQA